MVIIAFTCLIESILYTPSLWYSTGNNSEAISARNHRRFSVQKSVVIEVLSYNVSPPLPMAAPSGKGGTELKVQRENRDYNAGIADTNS